MDARHTMKCDIYEFNRPRKRCYRYTTFQWWCGFSISIDSSTGNATEPWILVRMHMAIGKRYKKNSHKWQMTVGLPVTSERYWASLQVIRLFHSVTVSQYGVWEGLGLGLVGGGAQLQCIYYLVLYTDLKAAEGISAFQTSHVALKYFRFSAT